MKEALKAAEAAFTAIVIGILEYRISEADDERHYYGNGFDWEMQICPDEMFDEIREEYERVSSELEAEIESLVQAILYLIHAASSKFTPIWTTYHSSCSHGGDLLEKIKTHGFISDGAYIIYVLELVRTICKSCDLFGHHEYLNDEPRF